MTKPELRVSLILLGFGETRQHAHLSVFELRGLFITIWGNDRVHVPVRDSDEFSALLTVDEAYKYAMEYLTND